MNKTNRYAPDSPNRALSLSFNESQILSVNIRYGKDKESCLQRLTALSVKTKDPLLCQDIISLREKLKALQEDEFQQLRQDAIQHKVLFPHNYHLPTSL